MGKTGIDRLGSLERDKKRIGCFHPISAAEGQEVDVSSCPACRLGSKYDERHTCFRKGVSFDRNVKHYKSSNEANTFSAKPANYVPNNSKYVRPKSGSFVEQQTLAFGSQKRATEITPSNPGTYAPKVGHKSRYIEQRKQQLHTKLNLEGRRANQIHNQKDSCHTQHFRDGLKTAGLAEQYVNLSTEESKDRSDIRHECTQTSPSLFHQEQFVSESNIPDGIYDCKYGTDHSSSKDSGVRPKSQKTANQEDDDTYLRNSPATDSPISESSLVTSDLSSTVYSDTFSEDVLTASERHSKDQCQDMPVVRREGNVTVGSYQNYTIKSATFNQGIKKSISQTTRNRIEVCRHDLADHMKSKHVYSTRLIKDAVNTLSDNRASFVILHGYARQGKTTAAKEILSAFSNEESRDLYFNGPFSEKPSLRKAISLPKPGLWFKCININSNFIVMIDNMKIKTWESCLSDIQTCTKGGKILVVITISENEFKKNRDILDRNGLLRPNHTFGFASEEYMLNTEEKLCIMQKFIESDDRISRQCQLMPDDVQNICKDTSSLTFFGYMDNFFNNNSTDARNMSFFNQPLEFLYKQIDGQQHSQSLREREMYAFLCMLYAYSGSMDLGPNVDQPRTMGIKNFVKRVVSCSADSVVERIREHTADELIRKLRVKLKLDADAKPADLRAVAKMLNGSFVLLNEEICTFADEAIMLTVGLSLLHQYPQDVLRISDHRLIEFGVRPKSIFTREQDIFFEAPDDTFYRLAKIMKAQLLQGDVNRILQHPLFDKQRFCNHIFKADTELKVLMVKDFEDNNSPLFHVVGKTTFDGSGKCLTDMVGTITERTMWRQLSSSGGNLTGWFVQRAKVRDLQNTKSFVKNQNYLSLLKAFGNGAVSDCKHLIAIKTPVTKACVMEAAKSGSKDVLELILQMHELDEDLLSKALFCACKARVATYVDYPYRKENDLEDTPDAIQYLVYAGADVNHVRETSGPLIHLAVETTDEALFELLLSLRADIHAVKSDYKNLFHVATAVTFNFSIAERLLECNVDINSCDLQGRTPLHEAILHSNQEGFEFIIAHGAKINAKDNYKQTPLHLAVANLDESIPYVDILVENGAVCDNQDIRNETPLLTATRRGKKAVVERLIRHGVEDVRCAFLAVESNDDAMLELLVRCPHEANFCNINGKSLLEVSVGLGESRMTISKYLLSKGANHNTRTARGINVIVLAVKQSLVPLIDVLLEFGASTEVVDKDENSILHVACALGDEDVVAHLLEKFGDSLIETRNLKGWAPVHFAAFCGRPDITKKLLGRMRTFHLSPESKHELRLSAFKMAAEGKKKCDIVSSDLLVGLCVQFGSEKQYQKLLHFLQ